MAAWTLVAQDDGQAISADNNNRTEVNLTTALQLTPGTYGIALESVGSGHLYTNGTAANQMVSDANIALSLGQATNVPFTGNIFSPRVWNGSICYEVGGGLVANFTATPTSGPLNLNVTFTDTSSTSNPSGVVVRSWDFGDGSPTANGATVTNPLTSAQSSS